MEATIDESMKGKFKNYLHRAIDPFWEIIKVRIKVRPTNFLHAASNRREARSKNMRHDNWSNERAFRKYSKF